MRQSRPLTALRTFALSRSRSAKRATVMLVDAGACAVTCTLSAILRPGPLSHGDTSLILMICVSLALAIPIFHALGLYREIFSQSGVRAIGTIGRACAIYAIPFAALFALIGVWRVPRPVGLIQPILLFSLTVGARLIARSWLLGSDEFSSTPRRRVLIYGAGTAGRQLSGAIAQSADMKVVGYFDDNPALVGSLLDGCRIYAPDTIATTVEKLVAEEILLAIPSASPANRRNIVAQARLAHARIRTLPDLMDIAHGRVDVTQVRDLDVEDLLGRKSVHPDLELMGRHIRGHTVMVTGAGGSIGGELCRQLLNLEPSILLLVEFNEFGLYEINRELLARAGHNRRSVRIVPLLGSVNDEARLDEIVGAWRPDTIYHAAAYKHVPLVEHNPAEGVRTNVLGTFVLASVATRWRVADFVLISTDKAVRPASVMGATKRAAELVLQGLNEASPATRFSIVRFGNVLGSSGSVVPLFRRQILEGGPVTITDSRITRYFMTLPEAAELVLQASSMARGGEVFVLDMGPPVRILDLARNMIQLAGFQVRDADNPDGDIEIVEIGLRPGEKLHEELLVGNDPRPTEHPRILKADRAFLPLDLLKHRLDRISVLLGVGERRELIVALQELVPEFDHQGGLVDWVSLETDDLALRASISRIA